MAPVDLVQASSVLLERDSARKVGSFYVLLAQASPLVAKREVT